MTVRFGVVGTGYWAERVHLAALAAHEGVDLVGVWGRDHGRTERPRAQASGSRPFAAVEEMLEAVDAVSFAVPPAIQAPLALVAAGAGKHLLLEKPLALQTSAAHAIVQAVEEAKVAALVFFTRRFEPEYEHSIRSLAAQGPWREARGRMHSGAMLPGTPFAGSTWRQEKGALWDIGPHALAVLLPIMGPVIAARASQDARRVTTLSLQHASGASSTMALCLHEETDTGQSYRFTAGAREATLTAPAIRLKGAYGAAISELLLAIAAPSPQSHRCGVQFAPRRWSPFSSRPNAHCNPAPANEWADGALRYFRCNRRALAAAARCHGPSNAAMLVRPLNSAVALVRNALRFSATIRRYSAGEHCPCAIRAEQENMLAETITIRASAGGGKKLRRRLGMPCEMVAPWATGKPVLLPLHDPSNRRRPISRFRRLP